MAFVDRIWVHQSEAPQHRMNVYVKLHPAGEVMLPVEIPKAFHDSLLRLAQTAANAHEAQMQAQLLGEKTP